MTVLDAYDFIARGGLPAALLLILWAGARRWWVWGYQLEQAEKRADRFEALALDLLHLANKATDAAAKGPRDA